MAATNVVVLADFRVKRPPPTSKPVTRNYAAAAVRLYEGQDNIDLDDAEVMDETEDGAWVSAAVWVPKHWTEKA